MNVVKKLLMLAGIIYVGISSCYAESASIQYQIQIPSYMQITPTTSPVLTAYVSDKTGNLKMPLRSTFRVISNCQEKQTLYLKANAVTANGMESAMFMRGNRVYIAFARLAQLPTSNALANCKMGGNPADSPGVVAYPINSVRGAENKYNSAKGKYEVFVENGITDISVDIGTNVLLDSFSSNDPKGYYQAILSLTETDI
ncbi:MAG: hypothetical protein MJ237_07300 [bacterium]|nr:hypothetical protein [bacterium]